MSLPYRLGSRSLFVRAHEDSIEPRPAFLIEKKTAEEVCAYEIAAPFGSPYWKAGI